VSWYTYSLQCAQIFFAELELTCPTTIFISINCHKYIEIRFLNTINA